MFKNLLFLSLLTVCSSLSAAQQKPTIEILPIGMDLETYREMHKAAVIKEAIDHSVKHAPEELRQHISQNPSLAHYTYWFTETAESRTDGYCVRIGKGQVYYLYTYKIDEYISKIIIDESTGGLCMYAEQKNRFTNNSSLFQESTSNPKKGVSLSNFSMMKKKNEEILLKEANAHSIINAPEDLKQYLQSNSALSDYAYWFLNKAECAANAYAVKMANGTEYYLFKYRVNKYLPKVSTEPSGKLNIVSENSNYFTNDADLFQKIQTLLNQEPSYSRSNIKDPFKEQEERFAKAAQDRQERFKEIDERMAKFSGHSSSEKNIPQSISSAPQELLEKMNLESKQEPSILDSKYWLKNDSEAGYVVYKYMIKNEEGAIYTNDFTILKNNAKKATEVEHVAGILVMLLAFVPPLIVPRSREYQQADIFGRPIVGPTGIKTTYLSKSSDDVIKALEKNLITSILAFTVSFTVSLAYLGYKNFQHYNKTEERTYLDKRTISNKKAHQKYDDLKRECPMPNYYSNLLTYLALSVAVGVGTFIATKSQAE